MPLLTQGHMYIDFTDDGKGEPVILIHSSASGNRQWRSLIEALKDRYRVLAINLFGYGNTTPWHGDSLQTLADQAGLVLALSGVVNSPLYLVGHSFGGSVALKAASLLGNKVVGLVLLEPNPFYLLAQDNRGEAYAEARALRDHVKQYGAVNEWRTVAERFADYWAGDGMWTAMSAKRQDTFLEMLPNNFHEWDAVMNETTPIDEWKRLAARTLVVYAGDTKRPIREIVELFSNACPHWSFVEITAGGHMAPLTHPDLVNPIVAKFLDSFRNH
jgi:pimeloyl-ACP methyl ester carboxylesterase